MKIAFIITAAGSGARIGREKNKTLLEIGGKPILEIIIDRVNSFQDISEIIVTARKEDIKNYRDITSKFSNNIKIVVGGKTRSKSVLNALKSLDPGYEYVMVHDAARPFLSKDIYEDLKSSLMKNPFSMPALTPRDTVYDVKDPEVPKTLDRDKLAMVQTPQCFNKKISEQIIELLSNTNKVFTDEASVVLELGEKINFTTGSVFLNKITQPEDLITAEALYEYFITKEKD